MTEKQVQFIADENYGYWKKINPMLDYKESTENILSMKDNSEQLPIGIALVKKDKIIGFCTLRENRLKNYPEINPWICNVLVFKQFRGKGYAKMMLDFAGQKLKALGYNKIYVWTDQTPDFYKKLDWGYEKEIEKNEGGMAMLFSKKI